MKGDQQQMKKVAEELGEKMGAEGSEKVSGAIDKALKQGVMIKDVLGFSDSMVEGIYGQAFRLYNTGKYKDASQLFRLLIMMNATEPKYILGMAACYHMLKEFKNAVDSYMICAILDPKSPVPYYHSADCYIQMHDPLSATVSLDMAISRAEEKPEYQTLRDRAKMMIEGLKKEVNANAKKEKPTVFPADQ